MIECIYRVNDREGHATLQGNNLRTVVPVLLEFYKKFENIALDKEWFKSTFKINKTIYL